MKIFFILFQLRQFNFVESFSYETEISNLFKCSPAQKNYNAVEKNSKYVIEDILETCQLFPQSRRTFLLKFIRVKNRELCVETLNSLEKEPDSGSKLFVCSKLG